MDLVEAFIEHRVLTAWPSAFVRVITQRSRGRHRPLPDPTAKRPRPRLDFEPRPLAFLYVILSKARNWPLAWR